MCTRDLNNVLKEAIKKQVFPRGIRVFAERVSNDVVYAYKLTDIISRRVIEALSERNRLYVNVEPASYDYKQTAYYPLTDLAIKYYGGPSLPGTS